MGADIYAHDTHKFNRVLCLGEMAVGLSHWSSHGAGTKAEELVTSAEQGLGRCCWTNKTTASFEVHFR